MTILQLDIERAVAGGRMLARHDGRVVLVAGAIPGETVLARVERERHHVVFARVVDVLAPSPDRRDPGPDPACGGMHYAHVFPPRQRALKAEIVRDAFRRLAGETVGIEHVHASPEVGYRMRVRLHLRAGQVGSFREGTHEVCDVRHTRQVLDATVDVVDAVARCLVAAGVERLEALELAENLDATERVLHLDCGRGERLPARTLAALGAVPGLGGVSWSEAWSPRIHVACGVPWISDPVGALNPRARPAWATVVLRRRARAFFQANRYLLPTLVQRVLARVPPGPVIDLYAGVGLFAVSAAAEGREAVLAVECDEVSSEDLLVNASAFGARLQVDRRTVEHVVPALDPRWSDAAVIVDPPRTGMSRRALEAVLAAAPPVLVYLSCDVATLARDARRFLEAGYELGPVEAFDLFPNTSHVEVLTHFRRRPAPGHGRRAAATNPSKSAPKRPSRQ